MAQDSGITVLGIDGGLASMGYAVVRLDPVGETVLAMGVIRTEKSSAKRRVLASDDVDRRAVEIAHELEALQVAYAIRAVCQESMSFPPSSSVSAKLGVARGVVAAHTARFGLPRVGESPQGIKKAVAGQKNASKEQVEAAVRERYCGKPYQDIGFLLGEVPVGLHEHAYDALAAIVACLQSDVVVTLRGEAQARLAVSSRLQADIQTVSVNRNAFTVNSSPDMGIPVPSNVGTFTVSRGVIQEASVLDFARAMRRTERELEANGFGRVTMRADRGAQ